MKNMFNKGIYVLLLGAFFIICIIVSYGVIQIKSQNLCTPTAFYIVLLSISGSIITLLIALFIFFQFSLYDRQNKAIKDYNEMLNVISDVKNDLKKLKTLYDIFAVKSAATLLETNKNFDISECNELRIFISLLLMDIKVLKSSNDLIYRVFHKYSDSNLNIDLMKNFSDKLVIDLSILIKSCEDDLLRNEMIKFLKRL